MERKLRTPQFWFLALLIHVLPSAVVATDDVTQGILKMVRTFDVSSETSDLNTTATKSCKFNGTVTFSHPISLRETDRFFSTGQLLFTGMKMVVDYINAFRCGIHIGENNYSISLITYGDESSESKTREVGNIIVKNSDVFLAGYSSKLTGQLAPIAEEYEKILVAPGSSLPSVFKNRDWVFGTLGTGNSHRKIPIAALAAKGAKSIAYVEEEGIDCGNLVDWATLYELNLTSSNYVGSSPTVDIFYPLAKKMSIENPDIMVTCVFELGCEQWIKAMRKANWSPKAQLLTVCVGSSNFQMSTGRDIDYMLGETMWHPNLAAKDAITGWSAAEFSELFYQTSFRDVTYQAVSGAAAVSILVQAIEKANSINNALLREQLASQYFLTMFGNITFDENGQSESPPVLLQYDISGKLKVVDPLKPDTLLYPMPSWGFQDCVKYGQCTAQSGECQPDGTCLCGSSQQFPLGVGVNATCKDKILEDMTYIGTSLLAVGIIFISLQVGMSVLAIVWTILLRKKTIVRASQPIFLIIIALGCVVISSSIIPMGIEAEYRYTKDVTNGLLTEKPNVAVEVADRACMAFPWLYGIGFTITFSALFAKLWRIRFIFSAATSFVRKKVEAKDVAVIMVIMLMVELVILLTWQIVAPLKWERNILVTDSYGFAIKSVGQCTSQSGRWFLLTLIILHILCLLYALYLSYVTRSIPSMFSESKWIAAAIISMLQILVLAIPIHLIVEENTKGTFFVRACVVFLQSATVTIFVFAPKMFVYYYGMENANQRGYSPTTGSESTLRRAKN